MVMRMKHELIAKDYVLYLIQYYASMQSWSKEQIIGQIVLHIEGEEEDVVRCKDCKHYRPRNISAHWEHKALCCARSAWIKFPEDGFCSYGEREGDT